MQAKDLADLYRLRLVDWARIEARLEAGVPQAPGADGPNRHTCWLSTIDSDGSPHVTAVGALWVEGAFWVETGGHTRKARNLARDPCALRVATEEFDLIVEGEARPVTDPGGRSPPSSARRRPGRRRGTSTG